MRTAAQIKDLATSILIECEEQGLKAKEMQLLANEIKLQTTQHIKKMLEDTDFTTKC